MDWPTWGEASLAASLSALVWLAARRWPGRRQAVHLAEAAAEFALIATLYAIWRLARALPLATDHGAIDRAHDIARFQDAIHLPRELTLQHFVIDHDLLAKVTVWYYDTVHVPALIAFLIWLYVRHRARYPHWRNGLALVTLGCLLIRFVRVAPPRFLPDLGYVDLAHRLGASIYGADVTTGVSDQFAAMPSIHVGWAAVVSFGIVAAGTSRWRWLFLLHVVATTFAVVATGNHWWLDAFVAVVLLWGGLALDGAVRRVVSARRERRRAPEAGAPAARDPRLGDTGSSANSTMTPSGPGTTQSR